MFQTTNQFKSYQCPFGDGLQELSIEVTRLVQPASASFDISTVRIPRCLVTLSSKYVGHFFYESQTLTHMK
jgi:hypothetical protein